MRNLPWLQAAFAIPHVLAGAVWLGAMVYSFFLLHPRARRYFKDERKFEDFIATISHGARWMVLGGLGVIGLTGVGWWFVTPAGAKAECWAGLIGAKAVVWLVAVAVFVYTSWRLWPARVLALDEEIPRFQKLFRRVAVTMIGLASLGMVLGIVAGLL